MGGVRQPQLGTGGEHMPYLNTGSSSGGESERLVVKAPEEFGAKREAGHDDALPITQTIEAAVKEALLKGQTSAKVVFRAGVYYAERNVQELGYNAITKVATEKLWNTQIPLPIISPEKTSKFTLILEGVADATVGPHWNQETPQVAGTTIQSTLKLTEAESKVIKEANGAGSVLGGPTKFVDEKPTLGNFSNMLLVTTNLCISQEKNPGLIGLDARQLAQHNINSCSALVKATPAELQASKPANQFGYGFYLPIGGNNDNQNINSLTVYGHYIGWVVTEHTTAQRVLVAYCGIGSVFSNIERITAGGVAISYLSSEEMSVAHIEVVGTGGAKKGLPLNIALMNTGEGAPAGKKDIIDPENILRGTINWECQAGEPGAGEPPRVQGGANLLVNNLYKPSLFKGIVTSEAIANEAILPEDVKPDVKPVPSGEENKVVVGTAGIPRKIVAAITGNAVATKFTIKHNLATQTAMVTFLTATFEEPVTMLAKSVAINASEIEVTFTIAPGAKVVNYVVIVG